MRDAPAHPEGSRRCARSSRMPRPASLRSVPIIHAVTDDSVLSRPDFAALARAVMRALGARGAVHLRGHGTTAARVAELGEMLAPEQERTGCWLLINDRVDVALGVGARGLQLTSRSIAVSDARRVAPGLAIGASVHDAESAAAAERDGADWVVAGHVFTTRSHPGEPGRGEALVHAIVARVRVPLIAIGGVRPEHIPALRAAGAHGVAAIRGVWGAGDASDAERAAIDYLSRYDATAHRPGA